MTANAANRRGVIEYEKREDPVDSWELMLGYAWLDKLGQELSECR